LKEPIMLSPEHGKESIMPFSVLTNPQQFSILTAGLEAFCRIGDIRADTPEHEEAKLLILSLYHKGATTADALAAAVEKLLDPRGATIELPGDCAG
jgi:hypothetical protein